MSTIDRQELIRNAVAFLADPKVCRLEFILILSNIWLCLQSQASPVTQRIQFLEAKGLTPAEIDIALKQAAFASSNQAVQAPYSASYTPNPYALSPYPRAHRWDWRDYFVREPA